MPLPEFGVDVPYEKARDLCKQTKAQSESALWLSLRRGRITASIAGRATRLTRPDELLDAPPQKIAKSRRTLTNLISDIVSPPDLSAVRACQIGRQSEKAAVELYEAYLNEQQPSVKNHVWPTGLAIAKGPGNGFMGASADRLVWQTYTTPEGATKWFVAFVLEIKTLVVTKESEQKLSIENLIRQRKDSFAEIDSSGQLNIKRTSTVWAQVQMQLAIIEKRLAHVVIYHPNSKKILVAAVPNDEDYWRQFLRPRLYALYYGYIYQIVVERGRTEDAAAEARALLNEQAEVSLEQEEEEREVEQDEQDEDDVIALSDDGGEGEAAAPPADAGARRVQPMRAASADVERVKEALVQLAEQRKRKRETSDAGAAPRAAAAAAVKPADTTGQVTPPPPSAAAARAQTPDSTPKLPKSAKALRLRILSDDDEALAEDQPSTSRAVGGAPAENTNDKAASKSIDFDGIDNDELLGAFLAALGK